MFSTFPVVYCCYRTHFDSIANNADKEKAFWIERVLSDNRYKFVFVACVALVEWTNGRMKTKVTKETEETKYCSFVAKQILWREVAVAATATVTAVTASTFTYSNRLCRCSCMWFAKTEHLRNDCIVRRNHSHSLEKKNIDVLCAIVELAKEVWAGDVDNSQSHAHNAPATWIWLAFFYFVWYHWLLVRSSWSLCNTTYLLNTLTATTNTSGTTIDTNPSTKNTSCRT